MTEIDNLKKKHFKFFSFDSGPTLNSVSVLISDGIKYFVNLIL